MPSRTLPTAAYAGLDFGTSNCLIALWRDGAPRLVELEPGESTLPSLVYVARRLAPIPEPSRAWITQAMAAARGRPGRAGAVETDAVLESRVRGQFAREAGDHALEALHKQTLQEALQLGSTPQFGRQALASSLEDPEGFFFRSPKSFLAADIDPGYRARFQRIVELMLTHLRERAEAVQGGPVTRACIGRPVHFGGGSPADQARGDERALALLEAAARRAGFSDIAFEFEPVAAALDFERQLDRDRLVLIVDVGGGTTDCTFARLGPERISQANRAGDILASSGERLGGNDVDTSLSFTGLMPAMGRGDTELSGLPVPLTPFADAADVFNVPAQNAFFRAERIIEGIRRRCAADVAHKLARLETLRQTQQTLWLTMKSEQAKVALAQADEAAVTLDRIDEGLAVTVTRAQLSGAIRPLLLGIERLMLDAVRLAQAQPELIYVTGGSARSPLVQAVIRETFPGRPVVMGDAYGSVVSGLAMQAHRLYGRR